MKFYRSFVSVFTACCLLNFSSAAEVAEKEPTNAEEAAQKKAKEDAEISAKFAAWKATVSPAQQKWETTLEENLGAFYLPHYKKDRVTGRATAWDYVEDDPKLPRVLLIGDSISRGYTLATRKALAGKANVHRAPENCGPTANGLKKIDIYLGDGKWDVIHFNFGIHDRSVPSAEYQARLEKIIERLEATKAKLIWASSTPIPAGTKYGDPAVIVRKNEEAAAIMAKHQIPIDDIYTAILPHVETIRNAGDVHFSEDGYRLMAAEVAKSIEQALK